MKFFFLILFLVLPLGGEVLTREQLNERIEASKAAGDQDPAAAEITQAWEEALAELKGAKAALASEAEVRKEIASLESSQPLRVPENLPGQAELAELEALLKRVEGLIEENRARLGEIDDHSKKAPGQTVTLIAEEDQLRGELEALEIPPLEGGQLEAAKHQKAQWAKKRREARLKEISARKELLAARTKVAGERTTKAKARALELKKLSESLETRIDERKKAEAKKTRKVIEVFAEAFANIPELEAVVEDLRDIRATQDQVEAMLAEARDYGERVNETGKRIEKQYESAKLRIELLEDAELGVDDETGLLLRRQRASLPSVDEISDELRARLEDAAKTEIALLDQADRLKNLSIISKEQIEKMIKEHPEIKRDQINDLFKLRQEALSKLVKEYRQVNEELVKGTAAARRTIRDIQEYSNFIDQRLLWIKSAKLFRWSEIPEEWGRIVDLVVPETGFLDGIWKRATGEGVVKLVLALLLVIAILLRQGKLRGVLKSRSEQAARRNCTTIRPTLEFIGAAILLSLWLPLLLEAASVLAGDSEAWRSGLVRLAIFLFLSSLLTRSARPDGLFVNHFRIHPERSALVHRNLQWLTTLAPAFVFIIPALTSSDTVPESGRTSFILGMLLLAGFCHHLFHPKRSILVKAAGSTGFSKFCYFLIMACPLTFLVGAVLGYFESVLTLRDQAGATAGLLVLAFVVVRLATRWTLVSRRKLAVTQALRRREVAMAEREREEESEHESNLPSLEEVKAEAVDVVEVEEQTTKLLKIVVYASVLFGLWGIWSSTLPALSILDKVELWKTAPASSGGSAATSAIPGMPGGGGGGADATSGESSSAPADDGRVTLQDLLFTGVLFALTFAAARNIPGVLSLTLFSRINMGPGGNFALTTTVRYIIVFTGIVMALGQIGITWGKVQWLAAAVSLGIGFGLQEIFANFVAGIILLFERPIRLGDIVTVGDISGSVTQIKIRATTIKQFNNRELLVPNKEFITSQLINWTLNDSILRVEVQVGIAYGSDTEKARGILEKILKEHPHIMEDPGPVVFFMGFGASTLDFEARGFVSSAEFLLGTKSELHYQIDNAFREAGIEIAFPQQDVHVRSLPAEMKPAQT